MLKRVALLVLLIAALSACGGEPAKAPLSSPVAQRTLQDGGTEQIVKVELTLRVSGAEAIDLRSYPAELRILEMWSDDLPPIAWFFSVASEIGSGLKIEAPDGRKLVFAASIAPGQYRGPGTYTLSSKGTTTIDGKPTLGSDVYIQTVSDERGGGADARFGEMRSSCKLVVTGEDWRTGSVGCPSLADEKGRTVAFSFSWKRV